jgi:hypothetical protein
VQSVKGSAKSALSKLESAKTELGLVPDKLQSGINYKLPTGPMFLPKKKTGIRYSALLPRDSITWYLNEATQYNRGRAKAYLINLVIFQFHN